jgi:hypothetical protein
MVWLELPRFWVVWKDVVVVYQKKRYPESVVKEHTSDCLDEHRTIPFLLNFHTGQVSSNNMQRM